ncbi:MAG: methyl-accepting chemotaxis protein, partial [Fretibacterium sp.]|nr:methyl-accepting chemotaxis protein [Fretibacterium sp.]
MSIKTKLRCMLTVVLLVILAMMGLTYFWGSSSLNDFLNQTGLEVVQASAERTAEIFTKVAQIASTSAIATRYGIERFGMDERQLEDLTVVLRDANSQGGIVDVHFSSEATGRISISSRWQEPDDYDARTRSWYQKALAVPEGTVAFTQPYFDLVTKQISVSAVMAVYSSRGTLLGVLGVDIDFDILSSIVVNLKIFNQGKGALFLQNGLVVAHHNEDYVLKANFLEDGEFSESQRAFTRRMVAGETGFANYDCQRQSHRAFFAPVGNGYYLSISFPLTVVDSIIRGFTSVLMIAATAALVLICGLALTITRGLSRSLNGMNAVTSELGDGDLSVRFDDRRNDELGRMAKALNGMLDSISDVFGKIQHESENTSRGAETLAALSEETLA